MQAIQRFLFSGMTAATLCAVTFASAYAHGGGILRVASKSVSQGGTIAMTGEKLGANLTMKAELRGVLDNYPLGSVRTLANGTLASSITISTAVPAGVFTLVLIAPDGDIAGRTEITVGSAATAAAAASGMPHMAARGDMAGMAERMGTAEMMEIEIRTSAAEWAIMVALILLAFGGGAALLARSRRGEA